MIKTRIAPSPTGDLHIGHLRTLLYNYAFSKKQKGIFLVRIEDTDRNRYIEGSMERTLKVIRNYGLDWDEGPEVGGDFGPYIQSQRLDLYKEHVKKLVESGNAYPCFCTSDRLSALRDEQQKQKIPPKYDRHCMNISLEEANVRIENGEAHVIRLKIPENTEIKFTDVVYGEITFMSSEVDDQVLMKSDGFPTYHLAVVVDDHLMGVTHVMRGNDWLPSTPKHVVLYNAFGWDLPNYIHLPNLKESSSTKKLSKRFGAVKATQFLEDGYLPEALLNFLMFLGWNPGTEKEIYSVSEFVEDFSIDRIHKTDLVAFDRQKLLWLNGHYIRAFSPQELAVRFVHWAGEYGVDHRINPSEERSVRIIELVQERMKKLSELNELTAYFYNKPLLDKELLIKYALSSERTHAILQSFLELYEGVDKKDWSISFLDEISHALLLKKEYKPKEAFMTVRVAISGVTATPPLFDVLEVLGKTEVLDRLKSAMYTTSGS